MISFYNSLFLLWLLPSICVCFILVCVHSPTKTAFFSQCDFVHSTSNYSVRSIWCFTIVLFCFQLFSHHKVRAPFDILFPADICMHTYITHSYRHSNLKECLFTTTFFSIIEKMVRISNLSFHQMIEWGLLEWVAVRHERCGINISVERNFFHTFSAARIYAKTNGNIHRINAKGYHNMLVDVATRKAMGLTCVCRWCYRLIWAINVSFGYEQQVVNIQVLRSTFLHRCGCASFSECIAHYFNVCVYTQEYMSPTVFGREANAITRVKRNHRQTLCEWENGMKRFI